MVKRKKRKLKLRWEAQKFLVYFIFFIFLIIYSINGIIDVHKSLEYKKTYQYKISQLGYTKKQTKLIIDKSSNSTLDYLLNNEYDLKYYEIISEKYYIEKNFLEYVEYYKVHQSLNVDKIIALVNVHASKGWYNETFRTDTSKGVLILVNKFYQLDESFKRDDLENISLQYSYSNNIASKEVIEGFRLMYKDVLEQLNKHLMVNSSYRSYEDQESIYREYKLKGETYADQYAARPGFSEHQTGLSLDITSLENPIVSSFKESDEYKWLIDNSYKYGFILRYPEGKEDITGYSTESWHFRYLGKDVAKKVYESGLTFDEYYAFYIEKR